MPRRRMTFEEMRNEGRDAAKETGVRCKLCGRQMTAEKTIPQNTTIIRYRECICGYKVITSQTKEMIVREVKRHGDDDEPRQLMLAKIG